jgi:hypothetical protein
MMPPKKGYFVAARCNVAHARRYHDASAMPFSAANKINGLQSARGCVCPILEHLENQLRYLGAL